MIGSKRVATSTASLQWARYHRVQGYSGQSIPPKSSACLPCVVGAMPHAETSAAGAARYQNMQSSRDQHQRSSQVLLQRHFSTNATHGGRTGLRKGKNPVNSYAPPDADVLRRRDEESQLLELPFNDERADPLHPHSGDIGWTTPEEMHFAAQTERGRSPRLYEEMERESIAKSQFSHRLSLAFDFLEDATSQLKSAETSLEEHASILRVVHSTRVSLQSLLPRQGRQRLQDVDCQAFMAVFASLIRITINVRMRMRDSEVMQILQQAQLSLDTFAPREFHRFVAEAGKAQRYDLVEALIRQSIDQWGGASDEWLLYAQARALGEGGQLHQLRGYWREYGRYRPFPSPSPSGSNSTQSQQRLRPPFYLFRYLLQAQLYSSSSQARCPSNILTILRVMHVHQYEMDDAMWMLVLKASPRLRIHLPRLLIARAAKQASGSDNGHSRQAQRLLLDMLEDRARKVVVRDVLLLLRLMQLSHRGIATDEDCVQATFLNREELGEAHAIAADFFGRLGHPERARRHFLQCYQKLAGDTNCSRCHWAARGVIQGYLNADRPREAVEYGLALIRQLPPSQPTATASLQRSETAEAEQPATLRASSTLIGALLQACAQVDPLSEVLPQARRVLDTMLASRLQYNNAVQAGLGSLFFAPQRQGYRSLDRMGVMVSHLAGLFSVKRGRTSQIATSSHDARDLPSRPRRRLRLLLNALRSLGFEESMQLRSRNARKVKIRKLTTRIDRLASDAEIVRTEIAGLEWMHDEQGQLRPSPVSEVPLASNPWDADSVGESTANDPPIRANAPANDDFDDAHLSRLEEIQKRREEAEREREKIAEVGSSPTMFASLSEDLQKELDRRMTPAAFAMRLRVYAVLRRDHEAAAYVYQRMLQHGISPTMLHVAPLIEGLALDGRIDEARAMAQSARWEFGVLTTARIQTALLRGLITAGRKDEAVWEFRHWREAGGRPDGTMWGLFDDEKFPRLANEGTLLAAVAEARRCGAPLALAEVDDAYRFLMRTRSPLRAQRLLLTAIEQTGFQPDADLRDAVRRAGNWIRKRFARQRLREGGAGEDASLGLSPSDDGDDDGGGAQPSHPHSPSRSLSYSYSYSYSTMSTSPHGRFHPEETPALLREAHALQRRALHHSLAASSGAAEADAQSKAYVGALREFVLDWISGEWSPVDSSEVKGRMFTREYLWRMRRYPPGPSAHAETLQAKNRIVHYYLLSSSRHI